MRVWVRTSLGRLPCRVMTRIKRPTEENGRIFGTRGAITKRKSERDRGLEDVIVASNDVAGR